MVCTVASSFHQPLCVVDGLLRLHILIYQYFITLIQQLPIESIAKMMGHSGIRTTQRYAEITDKKISKDMDNLMAVRMMYGTGKWYKRQGLPKETDLNNEQIGK